MTYSMVPNMCVPRVQVLYLLLTATTEYFLSVATFQPCPVVRGDFSVVQVTDHIFRFALGDLSHHEPPSKPCLVQAEDLAIYGVLYLPIYSLLHMSSRNISCQCLCICFLVVALHALSSQTALGLIWHASLPPARGSQMFPCRLRNLFRYPLWTPFL